jgi:hypothetical protein
MLVRVHIIKASNTGCLVLRVKALGCAPSVMALSNVPSHKWLIDQIQDHVQGKTAATMDAISTTQQENNNAQPHGGKVSPASGAYGD